MESPLSAMERYAASASAALSQALGIPLSTEDLETPPNPELGDFAFPCFRLAKERRKAPPALAQEIVAQLQNTPALLSLYEDALTVAPVGPYVNFTVRRERATQELLSELISGEGLGPYGRRTPRSRGRWILEYSSPNVAKAFNIYHIRTTIQGAALARMGDFRGIEMVRINHLGDWGTQYGKLAVALKKYATDLPAQPSLDDLVKIYIRFHEDAKTDPSLEDQARDAFARLEKGDPEIKAVWQRCYDISVAEFKRIYARLGVEFDHYWGESFYISQVPALVKKLQDQGLLVESEGAQVVAVTDRAGAELPPCILIKQDGSTIYATRDVAAALYRWEQFHFDRMLYVVGQEQKMHFEQVFGVLRRMGAEWEKRCEHLPIGLYRFKGAKMSTRQGNFVTLEAMLDLARDRVLELMRERPGFAQPAENDTSAKTELQKTAEAIAIGAVVFHDLKSDPTKGVDFDIDQVVDFEGETGPYLQYAHTRCLSILRKAADTKGFSLHQIQSKANHGLKLEKKEEIRLLKLLGTFPSQVERTLHAKKASQLASYLIDVAHAFGVFYRECQVLTETPELTLARLQLVEATRRILARGLGLLGVPLPERM